MDCKEINELINSYLDGEATPSEKEQIEKHLNVCPLCREELDELSIAQATLQQTLGVVAKSIKQPEKAWIKMREKIEDDSLVLVKGEGQGELITSFISWLRDLFTLKPIWKPVVVIALIIALVVSSVIVIPPMLSTDAKVMATDIALNNPEVINAFIDDPIESIEVIEETDDIAIVEIVGRSGDIVTVIVNLNSKTVISVSVGPLQYYPVKDLGKVISILMSDNEIKSIFNQGAIITNIATYHLERVAGEFTEKNVLVTISLVGELYSADIEVFSGQLLDFGDYVSLDTKKTEVRITKLYEMLEDPNLSEEDYMETLGILRTLGEEPVIIAEPWLPEGMGIIFVRSFQNMGNEIYGMNADGSNLSNLTNNPGYDSRPACSPDGLQIVFVSQMDDNSEIYVMNIDGSNQTNLTNNPSSDAYPAWSPGGSQIAFRSNRDGNGEIYVMDADGSNQTNLTNNLNSDLYPVWSPDGSQIAFRSNRDGNYEIYVMDADGSNQTNLTNNPAHDSRPSWSPDGSKIVFISHEVGWSEVYMMNADGSNRTRLTNNSYVNSFPVWSNDGSRIAFEVYWGRDSGHDEIYVMNADGSNQIRLTNNSSSDDKPVWSPDDSKIAFVSERDGNKEIYVMNADGSNQTRLTNNSIPDNYPLWLPGSSPTPPITTTTATPPTTTSISRNLNLVDTTFTIPAEGYYVVHFTVDIDKMNEVRIVGRLEVSQGTGVELDRTGNTGIEVLILDDVMFTTWANTNLYYLSDGQLHLAQDGLPFQWYDGAVYHERELNWKYPYPSTIIVRLDVEITASGDYYLIFSNRDSPFISKIVTTNIDLYWIE